MRLSREPRGARTRGCEWLDENVWRSPLASTQERFKEASDVIRR